jgi:hypothetical protein
MLKINNFLKIKNYYFNIFSNKNILKYNYYHIFKPLLNYGLKDI